MVSSAAILERVIEPQRGDLAPELARYILQLKVPEADLTRYKALAAKAQEGALSQGEQEELDQYLDAYAFLAIMQSKARVSLRAGD